MPDCSLRDQKKYVHLLDLDSFSKKIVGLQPDNSFAFGELNILHPFVRAGRRILVGDRQPSNYVPWRDTALIDAGVIEDPDAMLRACQSLTTWSSPNWSYGGSSWLFSGFGHTWYNHVLTPNSAVPDCAVGQSLTPMVAGAHSVRSLHSGGINAALADGSTRFFSDSTDTAIWRALGTADGGETVTAH